MRRYSEVDAGTLIPFIIASLLFAARMAARCARLGGDWGADDYTIVVAYVSPVPCEFRLRCFAHHVAGTGYRDLLVEYIK